MPIEVVARGAERGSGLVWREREANRCSAGVAGTVVEASRVAARPRPQIAVACFVLGCLLVLLVEAGIPRAVGVPLIFAGMALGVAAIVTPEFLAGDREPDAD